MKRHLAAAVSRALIAFIAASAVAPSGPAAGADIGFNESIRPILVENCFACHGADSGSREAGLRLDRREDAIDYGAIIPGDSDSTMLLDRIYSDDPELVMPPPETKKQLTKKQKQLLVDWIDEGAE